MGVINLFEYRVNFYFPKCDEAFKILEDCPFLWKGKIQKKHFVRKGDIIKYSFSVVFPGNSEGDGEPEPYEKLENDMTVIFKGMSNRLKALDLKRSNKIGYELIRVGLKKTIRWDDQKEDKGESEHKKDPDKNDRAEENHSNKGKGKK